MTTKKFSIRSRIRSFGYAFKGLGVLIREEHNSWIYLAVILVLIPVGILSNLSALEWILITLCIGAVISAEIFNTIIERISDKIAPEYDPVIGKIKDLGAAAVLVLAITSAVIGVIIFLPKIFHL